MKLDSYRMVFLDTAPFIYYFEDRGAYADKLHQLFLDAESGSTQLVTSLITYLEILTKPLATGDERLADKYRAYFTGSKNLSLLPFSIQCVEETARVRCRYGLKTPDAIQVASALTFGADCIVTNDTAWKRIGEVPVFCLDDL